MKPAICCVCDNPPVSIDDGDWITFSDYNKDEATGLSHPFGLEYFCTKHLEPARELSHMKSIDAVKKLRSIYPLENIKDKKISYQKKVSELKYYLLFDE
jgi:hypothetical protein